MKPLPNLTNDAALLLRGKQSALGAARHDAACSLRDACSSAQSSDWPGLPAAADAAIAAAERLKTLSAMWDEINTHPTGSASHGD